MGAVLLLDATSGRPLALMEGSCLTALRTGAAAAAAARYLARPEARVAALFGCGVQGRTQVQGLAAIRPLTEVWVYDPVAERTASFVQEMAPTLPSVTFQVADSPVQAVQIE